MAHIHSTSEYDFTATAIIVHKTKVLLLFHSNLERWVPPSGHIDLDETPLQALYRETEEETGLTREHLTLFTVQSDNLTLERETFEHAEPVPFDINTYVVPKAAGHRHIELSYIFESDTDKVVLEEGKAKKLEWFTLEEINELSPMPRSVYGRAKYALGTIANSAHTRQNRNHTHYSYQPRDEHERSRATQPY